MVEIKPNLKKDDILAYCRKCGRPYSEAFYLYTAEDRGKIFAAGLFEMHSDRVEAVLYDSSPPEDIYLFDGILRAALNYASGQGVQIGVIPDRFRQDNGAYFSRLTYPAEIEWNIVNFFSKYKTCRR